MCWVLKQGIADVRFVLAALQKTLHTGGVLRSPCLRLGKNNVRPSKVLHLIRQESMRSSDAGAWAVVVLGINWLGRGNDSTLTCGALINQLPPSLNMI